MQALNFPAQKCSSLPVLRILPYAVTWLYSCLDDEGISRSILMLQLRNAAISEIVEIWMVRQPHAISLKVIGSIGASVSRLRPNIRCATSDHHHCYIYYSTDIRTDGFGGSEHAGFRKYLANNPRCFDNTIRCPVGWKGFRGNPGICQSCNKGLIDSRIEQVWNLIAELLHTRIYIIVVTKCDAKLRARGRMAIDDNSLHTGSAVVSSRQWAQMSSPGYHSSSSTCICAQITLT